MDLLITSSSFVLLFATVFLIGLRFTAKQTIPMHDEAELFPQPAFGKTTKHLAHVLPNSAMSRESLSKELVSAGYYHFTATDNFLAKRNLALLTALLLIAGMFAIGLADGIEILVAIISAVVCITIFSVPRLVLASRAKRRVRDIEKAIPDALDMIAMTIAGGLPLTKAVERVAVQLNRTHRSLSEELQIITRQSNSGTTEFAFSSFASRINLPEVVAWCSLMRQSQRLGGKLVDSLTDYANRIREDRKNRAEKAGNTASIKLLLPVVTCICPPIAILLIGPAILDLRDFINREGNIRSAVVEQISTIREEARSNIGSQSQ